MAYATTNPPALVSAPLTGAGRMWYYSSTDVATDVDASGYFTNGSDLGLAVNDIMLVCDTDTGPVTTIHRVTAVTAGGAATVSTTGLTIT
jgi:hypothetical protein